MQYLLEEIPERRKRSIKGLKKSLKKFREFNFRDAKKLVHKQLDMSVPFIRIGKIPVITYMSTKEGKLRAYKHDTKKMPTLYMHPTKPIGILIGGSLKVKKWLYD